MLWFASVLSVLLLTFLVAPRVESASRKSDAVSTATEIRLIDPGWWPTKGTFARDQYVGSTTWTLPSQHSWNPEKYADCACSEAGNRRCVLGVPAAMPFSCRGLRLSS